MSAFVSPLPASGLRPYYALTAKYPVASGGADPHSSCQSITYHLWFMLTAIKKARDGNRTRTRFYQKFLLSDKFSLRLVFDNLIVSNPEFCPFFKRLPCLWQGILEKGHSGLLCMFSLFLKVYFQKLEKSRG